MQQIDLQVAEDHILSLTKVRKPLIAVEELIWNALDADANEVVVQLGLTQLEGLETISVSDDGFGIRPSECENAFGNLGGSPKLKTLTTPLGRRIHGKSGRGRFKAFGIGKTVTWRSRYLDNTDCFEFVIKCEKPTIRKLDIGDAAPARKSTSGVTVEIADIDANYSSLTNVDVVIAELAQHFALYLKQYPGITIKYEGRKVDPNTTQDLTETYSLEITMPSEEVVSAELTVIEWKHPAERALFLCDAEGFARHEVPARIQAKGFEFTAYLASERVEQMDKDGAFDLEGLHPEVQALVDASRNTLRTHFRKRESERAADVIREWQEEGVYPYEKPAIDILEQAERDVFNVCAVKVNEYLPDFESSDRRNKEFTFRLIRQALETNPTSLQKILQEVVALPQEQQDDFAKILGQTQLAAIINATKVVVDRLTFLTSLDQLLFGEFKKTLLERRQLHRILVEELWIFGEQYSIGVDDESLRNLLKKHIRILERSDIVPAEGPVKDLDGKNRVLDLMLYRRYPQSTPNNYEHLVIELKRPDCTIGEKEIGQIENYAFSVERDERFDKNKTQWTFLLLGNVLNDYAQSKCDVSGKEFGHIHASKNGMLNIHVKQWATIIGQAKWRYEFFREKLEHQVSTDDSLVYLREKYHQYLPKTAATHKGPIVKEAEGLSADGAPQHEPAQRNT